RPGRGVRDAPHLQPRGSEAGRQFARSRRAHRRWSPVAIFITGSTGYIGAHVVAGLLEGHGDRLNLLVRAADPREGEVRLWRALQLHLPFARFHEHLRSRITIFRGDITHPQFGLSADEYARLAQTTDSIIHVAASLNRKSEKACLNTNLRGTLEVVKLA